MKIPYLRQSLLAVVFALVTYIGLEAAYRLYKYNDLRQYREYAIYTVDVPLYRFDKNSGFQYTPNLSTTLKQFDENNNLLRYNTIRTNNVGQVSSTDAVVAKLASEFRIAIIGDSFTASLLNDSPWPAILERYLNDDAELKKRQGVSSIKVLNFGMDGTGIAQWDNVDKYQVSLYGPDLVIVNFITGDIMRKFNWRETMTIDSPDGSYYLTLICGSLPVTIGNRECNIYPFIGIRSDISDDVVRVARLKREVYDLQISRLEWFSLYPELFARTIGYHFGMAPRLTRSIQYLAYYDSQKQGVSASAEALRSIAANHDRLLILYDPSYDEDISSRKMPALVAQLDDDIASSGLETISMMDYLPVASDDEIRLWFNLPYDAHFSNYGAEIYANAVYTVLKKYLAESSQNSPGH